MKCFTLRLDEGLKEGAKAIPIRTEKDQVRWNFVVSDLDGIVAAVGPMFLTFENEAHLIEVGGAPYLVKEVPGKGALLLIIYRSLNHGQLCGSSFLHQRKIPMARVCSPIDGLPLAELWVLENKDVIRNGDHEVTVDQKGICRQQCQIGINRHDKRKALASLRCGVDESQ